MLSTAGYGPKYKQTKTTKKMLGNDERQKFFSRLRRPTYAQGGNVSISALPLKNSRMDEVSIRESLSFITKMSG